jgi:glycosyltransferase involved in cell wall biosynthesis
MPAFNAEATIAEALRSLSHQVDAPTFEVIVADNGSTDGTASVAQAMTGDVPRVRVVDASGRKGASHARNVGVRAAVGEILLFCDADDVVSPRWVSALAASAEKGGLATGPSQFVPADAQMTWPLEYTGNHRPRLYLDRVPYADSANLGITSDLFERVGGFAEDLRQGEDVDLSCRAAEMAVEVIWAREALVAVRRRPGTAETMAQFYKYGLIAPALLERHRDLFESVAPLRRREPIVAWLKLLLTAPQALSSRRRLPWLQNLANRCGRTVGSTRTRTWCP